MKNPKQLPGKFTAEHIEQWLGPHENWDIDAILETFVDLANRYYTIENMRQDINDSLNNNYEENERS